MRTLRRRPVLIGALALVLVLPSSSAGGRQRRTAERLEAYLELLETVIGPDGRSGGEVRSCCSSRWPSLSRLTV